MEGITGGLSRLPFTRRQRPSAWRIFLARRFDRLPRKRTYAYVLGGIACLMGEQNRTTIPSLYRVDFNVPLKSLYFLGLGSRDRGDLCPGNCLARDLLTLERNAYAPGGVSHGLHSERRSLTPELTILMVRNAQFETRSGFEPSSPRWPWERWYSGRGGFFSWRPC
jgi:hypothetical protein